tara:strand:- start:599 stop:781 length:183 start_codon:yes stop_codon:yes gene_type:complete
MKNPLSKYGKHFWVMPAIMSLYLWYDVFTNDEGGDLFLSTFFTGLSYWFYGMSIGKFKYK